MLHKNSIKAILDTIEQQKKEKLAVEQLAALAYMSGSHLQSLFKLLTGQPLMTYVRGRKLAHSLYELFNTNMRIIDIANEYGFAHEQSYIRAFQAEFDLPPSKARRQKIALTIRERISADSLTETSGGLTFGPEHVIAPGFHIVGVPTRFRDFDVVRDGQKPNAVGREAYFNILSKLAAEPDVYYGLCRYLSENEVEYMSSVKVSNLNHVPVGLKGWSFPPFKYVKFRYVGKHPPEEITMVIAAETYKAVDHFFRNQSRYLFPGDYHYERIDTKKYDGVFCQMDLFFPIIDRQEDI